MGCPLTSQVITEPHFCLATQTGHQTQSLAPKGLASNTDNVPERACPSWLTFRGSTVCCFISTISFNPLQNPELGAATVIPRMKKQRGEVTCPWSPSRRGTEPEFEMNNLTTMLREETCMTWVIAAQTKAALRAVGTLRQERFERGGSGRDWQGTPTSRDLKM